MDSELVNMGLKTLAMLCLVLGLLFLTLYSLKKFSLFRRNESKGTPIRVISSHYLSGKERIEIIEVSGERLVLAVTPGQISFLTKLADRGDEECEDDGES